MQDLLDTLTNKELRILRKHADLRARVLHISKMDTLQIFEELKDVFDLDIEFFNNHDVWISTERVEDAIPEWFDSHHYGWFRSQTSGEFSEWAKNFLLQEVKINIWVRYMEHKKNEELVWDSMSGYAGYA